MGGGTWMDPVDEIRGSTNISFTGQRSINDSFQAEAAHREKLADAARYVYMEQLRNFFNHYDPTRSNESIMNDLSKALETPQGFCTWWKQLVTQYGPAPVSHTTQGTLRQLLSLPSDKQEVKTSNSEDGKSVEQFQCTGEVFDMDNTSDVEAYDRATFQSNKREEKSKRDLVAVQIMGMNYALYRTAIPSLQEAFCRAIAAQMSAWTSVDPSCFQVEMNADCVAVARLVPESKVGTTSGDADEGDCVTSIMASSVRRVVRSGSASLELIKTSYQKDLKGGDVLMAVTTAHVPPDAFREACNACGEVGSRVWGTLGVEDDTPSEGCNDDKGQCNEMQKHFRASLYASQRSSSDFSLSESLFSPPPSFFYRGATVSTANNATKPPLHTTECMLEAECQDKVKEEEERNAMRRGAHTGTTAGRKKTTPILSITEDGHSRQCFCIPHLLESPLAVDRQSFSFAHPEHQQRCNANETLNRSGQ